MAVSYTHLDVYKRQQYGGSMFTRTYDTYSQLLDDFYTQRDNIQRMRHRIADLLKVLAKMCIRDRSENAHKMCRHKDNGLSD